ncbi:MAG: penicillin-binding transpeptidase domain-containing protein [Bacteroidota bacterium]
MTKLALYISISISILMGCFACQSNKASKNSGAEKVLTKTHIRTDFSKFFKDCPESGSIAIYDYQNKLWTLSDTIHTKTESLPASTFKIINFLIALETEVIKNEHEIVSWTNNYDTAKYGHRPAIYRDMTIEEAFKVSAGWVFIELAKRIGKDKYKKYLSESKYGNVNLSQEEDDFWNFGAFGISPINQVEFLKNFYEENLPFAKKNIQIVKKVMIIEDTKTYTLRAKTGWTRESGMNTGWWVGYLEHEKGTYFFATRLLRKRSLSSENFGSCRKEITKKVFRELGIFLE